MIGCRECGGIIRGTMGVARSVLGVQKLSQGAIRQRMDVCRECEHSVACKHNARQVCKCKACGCWLSLKTKLRNERCPVGKW